MYTHTCTVTHTDSTRACAHIHMCTTCMHMHVQSSHTHTHGHAHADTHEYILYIHSCTQCSLIALVLTDLYLKCWSHIVFLTNTNMQWEGDGDGTEYGLQKYNACSGRLQNVFLCSENTLYFYADTASSLQQPVKQVILQSFALFHVKKQFLGG